MLGDAKRFRSGWLIVKNEVKEYEMEYAEKMATTATPRPAPVTPHTYRIVSS